MNDLDDLKTMFKSGNDVPVTRVTIALEQFERICEMFKNQHDSGLAVIKENQQLRFDNTELVQERDRLRFNGVRASAILETVAALTDSTLERKDLEAAIKLLEES